MNAQNVAIGKPKTGGAVYYGATDATLPSDASTTLDTTVFKELGYCSDAGVVNSGSRSVTDIKAWGGDIIASPQTEKKDTFKLTLVEAANEDVLKVVHGSTNVSGALATGLTVKENAKELDYYAFVIDMVLSADVVKRVVIPNGKITEVGDVTYKDDTAVGYEVTITAFPNSLGDTHYEYILKA